MSEFDPTSHSHRRLNPLTGEFILVSPHRNRRPWLGQTESPQSLALPSYDPECYLCPGNLRANGAQNPSYLSTFTFENDYPAVLPSPAPSAPDVAHQLFQAKPVQGNCDVLVYHSRHDLTFARLSIPDVVTLIDEWISIYSKRGSQHGIEYVQIFENKGPVMGCSNPHPHGQVWSLSEIPTIPAKELDSLRRFSLSNLVDSGAPKGPKGRPCMICEYSHAELQTLEGGSRIITSNEHWVAVVPWWATWPYEIMLMPYKRHIQSISNLTAAEKLAFAKILSSKPTPSLKDSCTEDAIDIAHLHVHYSPPLLRNANIKKFLVGFELMAEAQRDLTPEQAAAMLRQCSEVHYLDTVDQTKCS